MHLTRSLQRPLPRLPLLPLLAAIAALPAAAQVTSMSATATYAYDGGPVTTLNAVYPPDGVDVLNFSGSTTSSTGLHTYGSTTGNFGSRSSGNGVYAVTGKFNITETISNPTASAVNAVMNFNITPGQLSNTLSSALVGTEFINSSIGFNIEVNSSSVWNSSAILSSTAAGTSFSTSGADLYTMQTPTYYAIAGGAHSVSLGSIAANSSITLSYTLFSSAYGNSAGGTPITVAEQTITVPDQTVGLCAPQGLVPTTAVVGPPCGQDVLPGGVVVIPAHTEPGTTPAGSQSSSGDPFTIDADGHVVYYPPFLATSRDPIGFSVTTTPVPEPGALVMLLAGLGVVGWRARRR